MNYLLQLCSEYTLGLLLIFAQIFDGQNTLHNGRTMVSPIVSIIVKRNQLLHPSLLMNSDLTYAVYNILVFYRTENSTVSRLDSFIGPAKSTTDYTIYHQYTLFMSLRSSSTSSFV